QDAGLQEIAGTDSSVAHGALESSVEPHYAPARPVSQIRGGDRSRPAMLGPRQLQCYDAAP
ncbi:MAG: hypothetical protein ACT60Q_01630, partial [Ferrovibrionaceae bacterium]